jgi:hypothetical protein
MCHCLAMMSLPSTCHNICVCVCVVCAYGCVLCTSPDDVLQLKLVVYNKNKKFFNGRLCDI